MGDARGVPAASGAEYPGVGAQGPLARALLSFTGLRVGDCFGEQFLRMGQAEAARRLNDRTLPAGPWPYTDDTLMAGSLLRILERHGQVREELLLAHFAEHFDATRGYGAGTHRLLERLRHAGFARWRDEAGALFGGGGSLGNGAAMRVAPLGAYFAEEPARAAAEAARSARVTHAHPEGVAGAVAVAVGAALAWQSRATRSPPTPTVFLDTVRGYLEPGAVRDGLTRALDLGPQTTPLRAGALLGSGTRVTAEDTVPFALWSAAQSLDNWEDALWRTASAGGDSDTTCAMVGGIVVLRTGGVPEVWAERAERLSLPG